MSDLLKQSYETYGFISYETILKMRNSARLEVGQTLLESSKKSILRASMEGSKFNRKELEELFKWFQVSRGNKEGVYTGNQNTMAALIHSDTHFIPAQAWVFTLHM